MNKITTTLRLAKTTPGTHVYQEDVSKAKDDKTFPTIYVQKHALPDPPPKEITVTIETP